MVSHRELVVCSLLLIVSLMVVQPAEPGPLPIVSTKATLSILMPPVELARAGANARQAAVDGMDLGEGDRVVTGPVGVALITFLDGSTVTVEPGSEVTVRRADVTREEGSSIRLLIYAGRVWARLAGLLGRRSIVSLESSEYAATAHDGLIGAERRAEGGFVCWTRAGMLTLTDGAGTTLAVLAPDHKATIVGSAAPVTESFRVQASALEVAAPRNVQPLVLMPDGRRVAGFVEQGIEVNQVFGSLTSSVRGNTLIEIPAGMPGAYTLLLTGRTDGPFTLVLVGRHNGEAVYRRELTGTIARGQRLATRIEHWLERESAHDPRTARVVGVRVRPLTEWSGALPGRVVLSPLETDPAAGIR